MLVGRIAVDDSDRLVLDQHRNGQERAQTFFPGKVGVHIVRILRHVQHRDRSAFLENTPADTLAYFQIRLASIHLTQALRRRDL